MKEKKVKKSKKARKQQPRPKVNSRVTWKTLSGLLAHCRANGMTSNASACLFTVRPTGVGPAMNVCLMGFASLLKIVLAVEHSTCLIITMVAVLLVLFLQLKILMKFL